MPSRCAISRASGKSTVVADGRCMRVSAAATADGGMIETTWRRARR